MIFLKVIKKVIKEEESYIK